MSTGHACPSESNTLLGAWLQKQRRSYSSNTLAAGKVAALKVVGVELDGKKARAIREQHLAMAGGRGKEAGGDEASMQIEEELGIFAFESEVARGSFVSAWERKYGHQADDGGRAAIAAAGEDGGAQGGEAGRGREDEDDGETLASVMALGEGRANKGCATGMERGGVAGLHLRESFDEKLAELKEYKRRHGAILRAVLAAVAVAVVGPFAALSDATLGSLHAVLPATDTSVHECMTSGDLGMCAGHACPPYRHASLGPWLSTLRKLFINQRLPVGKVAVLKAVGVEFDDGKARIIREQHEAQIPLREPRCKGKLDVKRSCRICGHCPGSEKTRDECQRSCQEYNVQVSKQATIGAKRPRQPARAPAGSASGRVRTKTLEDSSDVCCQNCGRCFGSVKARCGHQRVCLEANQSEKTPSRLARAPAGSASARVRTKAMGVVRSKLNKLRGLRQTGAQQQTDRIGRFSTLIRLLVPDTRPSFSSLACALV